MTDADADVIVVGSGPAGVCVAWPLVAAGMKVLMVEAGYAALPVPAGRPPMSVLRAGTADTPLHLLGRNLHAARDVGYASPKLRTAAPTGFGAHYDQANRITANGFRIVGSLAPGGLSNLWGAVTACFDAEDMAGWPIGPDDLLASYRSVAMRIGISGDPATALCWADVPLQSALVPSMLAGRLLAHAKSGGAAPLRLGRPCNAVLSAPLGDRQACRSEGGCMWGCPQRAVYNSAFELGGLARRGAFRLVTGFTVDTVRSGPLGWRVSGRRAGEAASADAPRLVLAAGTLPSARLVMDALGWRGRTLPLINTPAFAFALVLPSALGCAVENDIFGMAQLSFHHPFAEGSIFGLLYDAASFSAADLIAGMPLTRRGAAVLVRELAPAMMIGLAYFPGALSRNSVTLDGDGGLSVQGGVAPDFEGELARTVRALARSFRRLGAWILPGSTRPFPPGTEVHYGGVLPMGSLTDRLGQVAGAPGLHVVDGAILPSLPAQHGTFTIMANADRIGRELVIIAGGKP